MGKRVTRAEAERRAEILYSDRATAVAYMADAIQAGLNKKSKARVAVEQRIVRASLKINGADDLHVAVADLKHLMADERAKGGGNG